MELITSPWVRDRACVCRHRSWKRNHDKLSRISGIERTRHCEEEMEAGFIGGWAGSFGVGECAFIRAQ